jgi:hypothetical protein
LSDLVLVIRQMILRCLILLSLSLKLYITSFTKLTFELNSSNTYHLLFDFTLEVQYKYLRSSPIQKILQIANITV